LPRLRWIVSVHDAADQGNRAGARRAEDRGRARSGPKRSTSWRSPSPMPSRPAAASAKWPPRRASPPPPSRSTAAPTAGPRVSSAQAGKLTAHGTTTYRPHRGGNGDPGVPRRRCGRILLPQKIRSRRRAFHR